ncbi:MAG: SOS response-associated peptidase family protein [Bacteroidota bacterium]
MLSTYTFNSQYTPTNPAESQLPGLRLLEGGKFEPDQYAPVIVREYGQLRCKYFRWGLVPNWTKPGSKEVNGRTYAAADQVFQHMAYQLPIRRQRCLIPADGYYVQKGSKVGMQTYKLVNSSEQTFCFAGIYDTWMQPDGTELHSFAIVSTPAPEQMMNFGLQMPLILPKAHENLWLNPEANWHRIADVLYRPANHLLRIHKVRELQLPEVELISQVAA